MGILKIKGLKKHYGYGENIVKAVDDISLEIDKGEFISIIGQSGSGKSTLLHLMGGLDNPTEGKVIIEDTDLYSLRKDDLAVFRRTNIGFIFQNYNLIPVLPVYQNIVLPIRLNKDNIDEEYVNDIIEVLGLTKKINNYPNELSGGQQQRVAIARALAAKPSIVLADEPTGNLDNQNSKDVIKLLRDISKKFNQTVVIITHDNEVASSTDRVIKILDGKVV